MATVRKRSDFYDRLDADSREIRLLEICPSTDFSSPIVCSLVKAQLNEDSPPEYMALSYAWGDAKNTSYIEINGATRKVTTSLAIALRHIRKPDEEVVIWADAVSINQNDVTERNHQVSMMSSIFRLARSVIAWVGEESDDSSLALQFIKQWAEWITEKSEIEWEAELRTDSQKRFEMEAIPAAIKFANRAFWTRAWILQELVLPEKVDIVCGNRQLPLSCFWYATKKWAGVYGSFTFDGHVDRGLPYLRLSVTPMIYMLEASEKLTRHRLFNAGQDHSLSLSFDMMRFMERLNATDPRDKVYAILGLLPPNAHGVPPPDYTKSVEILYCEVAKSILLNDKSLAIVNFAAARDSDNDSIELPSWVPDWTRLSTPHEFTTNLEGPRQDTAIQLDKVIRFSNDNRILYCKGLIIDHVKETYPFQDKMLSITREDFALLKEKIIDGEPVGDVSALQAFFRAVSFDTQPLRHDRPPLLPTDSEYWTLAALFLTWIATKIEKFKQFWPVADPLESLASAFAKNSDLSRQNREHHVLKEEIRRESHVRSVSLDAYVRHLQLFIGRVTTFRTANGIMGVGVTRILPGDKICNLAGSSVPFVLVHQVDHYVVRGECFLSWFTLPQFTEDDVSRMQEFEIW